jgi:hypothetical protein
MTGGGLFWLIMFGVSALLFFGIAAVVGVRGFFDLLDLLRPSDRVSQEEKEP